MIFGLSSVEMGKAGLCGCRVFARAVVVTTTTTTLTITGSGGA